MVSFFFTNTNTKNNETHGDGTYTVKVRLENSTGKKAHFGLAWWADRD